MNVLNLFKNCHLKSYQQKIKEIDPEVLDHVSKLFSLLSSPMALARMNKRLARDSICSWAYNYTKNTECLHPIEVRFNMIDGFVKTISNLNDIETHYFLNEKLFSLYKPELWSKDAK